MSDALLILLKSSDVTPLVEAFEEVQLSILHGLTSFEQITEATPEYHHFQEFANQRCALLRNEFLGKHCTGLTPLILSFLPPTIFHVPKSQFVASHFHEFLELWADFLCENFLIFKTDLIASLFLTHHYEELDSLIATRVVRFFLLGECDQTCSVSVLKILYRMKTNFQ